MDTSESNSNIVDQTLNNVISQINSGDYTKLLMDTFSKEFENISTKEFLTTFLTDMFGDFNFISNKGALLTSQEKELYDEICCTCEKINNCDKSSLKILLNYSAQQKRSEIYTLLMHTYGKILNKNMKQTIPVLDSDVESVFSEEIEIVNENNEDV
jgi:hypothetical protein